MYDYWFVQTANHALLLLNNIGLYIMILFMKRDGINYFWSIKNSNYVLNKFKFKISQASKLSTYVFLHCILRYHIILLKKILLI